jgi:voltage-gated potassium channel
MASSGTAAERRGRRRLRRRVYEILEETVPGDNTARLVHAGLIAWIVVSVASVVLETVPQLMTGFGPVFRGLDAVSLVLFTIEYGLRVWAAPDYPQYRRMRPALARLAYARSPAAIIDLVTVVPFYLAYVIPADFQAFVVFRLLRFLKLARYSPGLSSLYDAVVTERRALTACLVILIGVVVATASVMHIVERGAQPDKFGTIPDAMWWAIVTLATVGYGDAVPITWLGKLVASVTAVMGLVMLALPVGIISSAFLESIHRRDFVVTWGMVARVPLFASLTAEEVAQIMRYLHSHSAEPGEVIVRRGEVGHSMYFIGSGQVAIEMGSQHEHRLGAGDFFGEVAVLQAARRSATVRAVVRTQLLVLDATDLLVLMESRPDIGERIRAVAEKRVAAGSSRTVEHREALEEMSPNEEDGA